MKPKTFIRKVARKLPKGTVLPVKPGLWRLSRITAKEFRRREKLTAEWKAKRLAEIRQRVDARLEADDRGARYMQEALQQEFDAYTFLWGEALYRGWRK